MAKEQKLKKPEDLQELMETAIAQFAHGVSKTMLNDIADAANRHACSAIYWLCQD